MDGMIPFKMNGKDYVGKLGPAQIEALEKKLDCGVFAMQGKMGMGFARTALFLAAMKADPKIDGDQFEKDFEAECKLNGLPALATIGMDMLKASGALGKDLDEEDSKKN